MKQHECFFDTIEGQAISNFVEQGKQNQEKTTNLRDERDKLRSGRVSERDEQYHEFVRQDFANLRVDLDGLLRQRDEIGERKMVRKPYV
jgi:hypothetical protein